MELNRPIISHVVEAGSVSVPAPLLEMDGDHVIIDAIKQAEDGRGFILRLYEAGRRSGVATITFPGSVTVAETNVLEEDQAILLEDGKAVKLSFRPFQIVTLRVIPKA
jgi:alpha-mannosidase